ncbi:MAG TPA: GNAT family protein [Verrucomicrobiae bacterium]|nr:GNAT family protein [Verrucomicrobiae bacterium]
MDHSIHTEGFGVRFRPVRMQDAAFIVKLRNSGHAKGFVGDSAKDIRSQETWLEAYFQRNDDYYFIIETPRGLPVGTYGIYEIRGKTAEQGRWVILPDVRAAAPSAIVSLDMAFGMLGFNQLTGSTVATNPAVLSLNRRMGFRELRTERAAKVINGQAVDLVHFVVTAESWQKARGGLVPIAQLAESQIREWEREQLEKTAATAQAE